MTEHVGIKQVRPLIGRAQELATLDAALQRAIEFKAPQLVLVFGNQGTGKSALIDEFLTLRANRGNARVFRGWAKKQPSSRGVIADLLADRFGISSLSSSEARVAIRKQLQDLMPGGTPPEIIHFLGSFLGLDFAESPFITLLKQDKGQRDEVARTVLCRFLELDAQSGPLVLVLEDLHWAGPTTLELISSLAASISGAPVLIVAAARPDKSWQRHWEQQALIDCERITLRNFEPDDAERFIRSLLARCGEVPDDIVDNAIDMTGGNPYFIEQLVRLFLAQGAIDTSGHIWKLNVDKARTIELPLSVEEAIEARIAALSGEERDVLEKGAVFGNVFWSGAVLSISRLERLELAARDQQEFTGSDEERTSIEAMLAELVDRDYLLRLEPEDSLISTDAEYVFKHNLERELVIRAMDDERTTKFHSLAGQWLDLHLSDRSADQLEFLGQLYERGGQRATAARTYFEAAKTARDSYANEQATKLYREVLRLSEDFDVRLRLESLHDLGDVLDRLGDTAQSVAQFETMREVAWLFDHMSKAGAAHGRLGRIYRRLGEYDTAMHHLQAAHRLFEKAADQRGVAAAVDDMGRIHWMCGAYQSALECHRRALALRKDLGDQRSIALSLANIARVHRDSGGFSDAMAQFREALDLRRDVGDLGGVVDSLCDLGQMHVESDDCDVALDLFQQAFRIANEIGDAGAKIEALVHLGQCENAMNNTDDALAHLGAAKELATRMGNRVDLASISGQLARVYLTLGDYQRAANEAGSALAIADAVGLRSVSGAAHATIGMAIAGTRDPAYNERIRAHFQSAVTVLEGINQKLELGRCFEAMASFEATRGNAAQASGYNQRAQAIYDALRGVAASRA